MVVLFVRYGVLRYDVLILLFYNVLRIDICNSVMRLSLFVVIVDVGL